MEVMRISGEIGERIAGGDDATEMSLEKEATENRLVCMVSCQFHFRGSWNGTDSKDSRYLDGIHWVLF